VYHGVCGPASTHVSARSHGVTTEGPFIVTRHASRLLVGIVTGNPIDLFTTSADIASDVVGWAYHAWKDAHKEPSVAARPSIAVPAILESIVADPVPPRIAVAPPRPAPRSATAPKEAAPAPKKAPKEPPRRPPTRTVPTRTRGFIPALADETQIAQRAAEIAQSLHAGTDFDNWLRAVLELQIAKRAEELARSGEGSSDMDNWLRAEAELLIAERAREIARSPQAGGDFDNWLQAERAVMTRLRAGEIARLPDAGTRRRELAPRRARRAHRAACARDRGVPRGGQ
jgi:hypothetical protein